MALGFLQTLRTTALAGFVGLCAMHAAPAPEAPKSVAAPTDTATEAAVALSHRANHLFAALSKGDPEAVRAAQLEVEGLRRTYSTLDVTPLVEAAAFWAREQGMVGRPTLGLEALQAVDRWAPDHPSLLGSRIVLMRQEGLRGWLWSFPDLLRLTRLRLEQPAHRWLWLLQHLGMLRLSATMLLWGWALTMGLRYRHVLRHIWEEPFEHKGISPALAALVGAAILTGPVLLGLDPLVAALLWLILLAPFLLPSEVRITAFIMLFQLVHPLLAVMEPLAGREPEPSIQTLQLQPRVHPVPAAALRNLPPTDQSFLKGWEQLQNQQWKDAEETFQNLVGRHPNQAEVLNNLGVARYQLGDAAGAERTFQEAQRAGSRMEVLLNQSILAFNRLDTTLGASKQDEAQAADPEAYARLIALNDARKDVRTYPTPLPDTAARVEALAEATEGRKVERLPLSEPPFLVALLLPLLGISAFLVRVRRSLRMAHPGQCIRCGEPYHTTDSPDPEVCSKCHHLFVLRDGLHTESRRKKLDEVAAHQRDTRWIHKTLIVLLPGCDLAFLGETREALMEFLPFCLAVGMVLATSRSVRYPGEILPDPASTWLALGAVLVGLLYLRSWLKLFLRRA
ncbi:tetratricopeptide repeat protein [Geothrix campi]|uniref:tetratricopeptide repeat protein n=1 Tax=Geothrix campi TaxID=2966450 RepID=UPI002148637E|nr:tetratricopeptide repeat protein [Geothrix sp. SG10]